MNAREAAFRSLLRIEKESRYSNLEADVTLKRNELSDQDARLYTRLVYGTIERKLTLDYILKPLVDQALEKLDREVLVILRLSAYQILFSDRIPPFSAVNEGVEICKKYRKSAAPLVNAVLRRLTAAESEGRTVVYPSEKDDPVAYLSAFYSVAPDICALLSDEFGMKECKAFLEAVNRQTPTTLRVNTLKTTREEFIGKLTKRGVFCEKTQFSEVGVRVNAAVKELPELESGECFVQDEASQLAAAALDALPGMTVLDLCACPGGKTFGAAMSMKNEGRLLSFDLHKNKLSLVRGGAERLGISIVETEEADARVFLPELAESADRVLVDAPCSGLGVMAKKPDLRYKDGKEIARLPKIQAEILENAARYVKPGGRLVYSTCTVLKRENEEIRKGFLAARPDFEEDDLRLPGLSEGASFVTLLPQKHFTDGFFISAFSKKKTD